MTDSMDILYQKENYEESERLIRWLRSYCKSELKIEEMFKNQDIPEDFLYEAGKAGLFGMRIPVEYEGLFLSLTDTMKVIEQVAAIDISLATYLLAQHTFSFPILSHAKPQFRKYYLPQIATGKIMGCFALSEPEAGSNPRGMTTSISPAGRGRWRINGSKCWITGAASARMFLVFGRHTSGPHKGISCFAVPGTTAGIEIGAPVNMLGVNGIGLRSVTFNDVDVGDENLIGEFGRGMAVAESGLLFGRFFTSALCSGIMKRCSQMMFRYALQRSMGSGLLLDNSVTIAKLRWIDAAISATGALSKVIADRLDHGYDIPHDAAIACKVSASELAWESADKLVQLLGARGLDERNLASQILRDTRFFRIGEGSTEPLLTKLGATLALGSSSLVRFLKVDMKASEAFDRLTDAISEVQKLLAESSAILSDRQIKIFGYYNIGRIGVWSFLEAGLIHQMNLDSDPTLVSALEWVRQNFDQTLNSVKGDLSVLGIKSEAFEAHLELYEQSIGKFDETTPVNLENLDTLLKSSVLIEADKRQHEIPSLTIIDLFETNLEKSPDADAVISSTESLTYRELAERVDKLSHILRDSEIVPGDVVGFCMGRTALLPVSLLAVLKTGAAVLLLNVQDPKERNRLIIEKAGAKILLTEEDLVHLLPETDKRVLSVDSVLVQEEREFPRFECLASPQSIAYIVFTSGSTGIPKGVRVTHNAICSQLMQRRDHFELGHHDRILHSVVPNFDIAIWELFGPFTYGSSIILSSDKMFTWDPRQVLSLIDHYKVTHIQLTPTQLGLLLSNLGSQSAITLKCVFCGGEVLPEDIKERFCKMLPEVELVHMYGPTEAVIDTTFCRPLSDKNYSTAQIGKPFPNKSVYILDEHRQPVPAGTPGELYIGGTALAEGYLEEPELTKQYFLPDPFSKIPGARMYKSGDKVRSLPSGSLEFMGRMDQQIKINGVRIEPGEIENVLERDPNIKYLRVVAHKSKDNVILVAYYVLKAKEIIDERYLRDFALKHLPKVMVPSKFIKLEEFPLTKTGKIDRKALSELIPFKEDANPVEKNNRSPISKAVGGIWEELLECKDPSNTSDFFEAGGNSLMALQVLTRIREIFAVEIDVIDFYQDPTIQGLAEKIVSKQKEKSGDQEQVAISRDENIPLAGTQKNFWYLYLMDPDSAAYNCPEAMRLKGKLNIDYLEWAINEVIKRHEALRTIFSNDEGNPLQVVLPERCFSLPVTDLSSTSEDKQEGLLSDLIRAEALRPFKLDTEPPFTARIFKFNDGEHVFFWNFHHIIADGWSSAKVFTNEINELYMSRCDNRRPVLPELSIQPIDYLYWREKTLSKEKIEKQKDFWKKELAGAPSEVDLTLGRSSVISEPGMQGHRTYFKIPEELFHSLKKYSVENSVSTYNVLMTAFAALAHSLSGADDISIGTVVAGRNHSSIKHVMGNFANVVVIRTDIGQNPTLEALLQRVKRKVLSVMDHSDIPFEEIVSTLKPSRDRNKNPLFNIFLSLFNGNGNELKLKDLKSEAIPMDPQTARFDFSIAMFEINQSLEGYVEYKTDLFNEATIMRIIKYYKRMLSAVISKSELHIGEVELADEEEERLLCHTWNNFYAPFPRDKCLHEMFEEQVKRVPEKTAITFGEISLTYGELNRRANKVARYLRGLDVKTGDFVGICVKSSVEMMVGVLGIAKAGCTYVPIDPALPQKRIQFIAEEIHSTVILAQSELAEHVAGYAKIICLDTDWNEIAVENDTDLNIPVTSDLVIYMIFTSGSTGKPKGVRTMHYNVAALLCNTNHMQVDEDDVFLKVNNFAFDISTWEIWSPLIYGASMIGIPEKIKLNPQEFANFVYDNSITMVYLPTALFHSISVEVPSAFKKMKLLVVGGEPLDPTRARDVLENNPPKEFINAYGPTEVTCSSAWYDVHNLSAESPRVPIGRPISNTQFYVLSRDKKLLPVGVIGELYIGGAGVSNGYHNRPDLNERHFISNPFKHDEKFKRLYRTGDFVRYRPDGNLEFMGRMDHQVKVRGFRIEIGEIENALREYEGVRAAIVMVKGDHVDNKRLVSFIEFKKEYKNLSADSVKKYLKERLPYYMIPSAIVVLDSFPYNTNGKVDRSKLNEVEISMEETCRKVKYPRNSVEVRLMKIWEDVIGFKEPGIHTNFFEAGGDSLKAVRLLSAISREFSRKLPLDALFGEGTIESLAIMLRAENVHSANTTLIPFCRTDDTVRQPLFLVHPLSGSAMCYSQLARKVDYPLYGIQQYGNKELCSLSLNTIEDLASYYLKSVLKVQPEGPYILGGWSLGGIISFEMARQLENMGHSVEKVIMFDSVSPGKAQKNLDLYAILKLCLEEVAEQFGVKTELNLDNFDIEDSSGIYESVLEQLKASGAFTPDTEVEALHELVDVCTNNARMVNSYQGGKLKSDILLLRPEDHSHVESMLVDPKESGEEYLGWSSFTSGDVTVLGIKGNHMSMLFDPNVQSMAEKIKEYLKKISLFQRS